MEETNFCIESLQLPSDKQFNIRPPQKKKKKKRETNMKGQNTHSLHACRKVQKLTHELKHYRLDILGFAKVRWTGFGETTMDVGH